MIILSIVIVAVFISILVELFRPETVVGDAKNTFISRVYYHDSEIYVDKEDKNELIIILKKYDAKRTLHDYFPYDPAEIDIEIDIVENHKPKHILLGEFNVWYESADKGSYTILNAQNLQDEIKSILE